MKICAICYQEAGEGRRLIWTKRAGYVVICWDCLLDLEFELGCEDEEEMQ